MSERAIPVGGICWEELQSADLSRAVPFYQELIGWETRAWPLPDGSIYTLFGPEGGAVAGAQVHAPAQTGEFHGWLSYVSVADVDAAAARVDALGGRVLLAPHDIPEVGRCAVLQDPEGALFALMCFLQPAEYPENPLGFFCWRELMVRDVARAQAFYAGVLGWTCRAMAGMEGYQTFLADGHEVGGLMAITEDMGPAPARWTPYLTVPDVDRQAVRAQELGGTVCLQPVDVPGVGRFCIATDPAGGTLALITLNAR
ncbi:MAG: VOC family protein [Candidatus Delongbacteria bacterium]